MGMTEFEYRQAKRQLVAYDEESGRALKASAWWLGGTATAFVLALAVRGDEQGIAALIVFLTLIMASVSCGIMTFVFGFGGAVAMWHHGRLHNRLAAEYEPVAPPGADVLEC